MSRNYYCEINLHLVWHCKLSSPLLTPQIEPLTYRFLKQRIIETPGAFVHEIGGIEAHVHFAVSKCGWSPLPTKRCQDLAKI